jgi:hypothetical protein
MKIRSVGAELFHAERRTGGKRDTTKLIVAFCNIVTTPKNAENREYFKHAFPGFMSLTL